jgi:CheY-like chemotaxis protein
VSEASNGREALERYRIAPVDIVLLDLSMPECDGPTTLGRFKQEFPRTRTRFILLSGDPDRTEPAHHPHLNGANGFHRTIAKPFELQAFIELVRQEYAAKAAEDGGGISNLTSNTTSDSLGAPLSFRS